MCNKVCVFDSSLRDGAQGEGISFTVSDKIKIVKALDKLGVSYIEAGNPGSNSKDLEFFNKVSKLNLENSKIVAFGSTRRKNISVEEDVNVQSLLTANTSVISIFGKSWDFHVTEIIKTSLEENLNMIKETVGFFKSKGKEVIFDAEHFFDGYKNNSEYALKTLKAALDGGADSLALCDTNGGMFPLEMTEIILVVKENFPDANLGVHCHNDCNMAVANSIVAVQNGVTQVQGTFLGYGERTGNTNLSSVIPNLQLKLGFSCIPRDKVKYLTEVAREIGEFSNVTINSGMPFVGQSAFAHKGGMHIDGVNKASHSFEHISPELVGNKRRFLLSEVAGRSSILSSVNKINPDINKDSKEAKELIEVLKAKEHEGYQYEGAQGSFEILVRKVLNMYTPSFNIEFFKTIIENDVDNCGYSASSMIKVSVDGNSEFTAAQGKGPIDAIDQALRKALEVFYPELKGVYLVDYKVRVLDTESTTSAKVRVIIESTDGDKNWTTTGVSSDIVEASLVALKDSIEYKLINN